MDSQNNVKHILDTHSRSYRTLIRAIYQDLAKEGVYVGSLVKVCTSLKTYTIESIDVIPNLDSLTCGVFLEGITHTVSVHGITPKYPQKCVRLLLEHGPDIVLAGNHHIMTYYPKKDVLEGAIREVLPLDKGYTPVTDRKNFKKGDYVPDIKDILLAQKVLDVIEL